MEKLFIFKICLKTLPDFVPFISRLYYSLYQCIINNISVNLLRLFISRTSFGNKVVLKQFSDIFLIHKYFLLNWGDDIFAQTGAHRLIWTVSPAGFRLVQVGTWLFLARTRILGATLWRLQLWCLLREFQLQFLVVSIHTLNHDLFDP